MIAVYHERTHLDSPPILAGTMARGEEWQFVSLSRLHACRSTIVRCSLSGDSSSSHAPATDQRFTCSMASTDQIRRQGTEWVIKTHVTFIFMKRQTATKASFSIFSTHYE